VDATIINLDTKFLAVDVDGIQVNIRKIDISGNPRFNIPDLFELGESIKCYAQTVSESSGEIRLSIRALERKRGEIILNKEKVFEMAEETAKKFFEESQKEKEKIFNTVQGATTGGTAGSMFDDDDDDLGF